MTTEVRFGDYIERKSKVVVDVLDLSKPEEAALSFINEHGLPDGKVLGSLNHGGDWGIVYTNRGIYALQTDGVGPADVITDRIPLIIAFTMWYKLNEEGTKEETDFTTCEVKLYLKNLKNQKIKERQLLSDFIKRFGAKLERNFWDWQETLKDIVLPRSSKES